MSLIKSTLIKSIVLKHVICCATQFAQLNGSAIKDEKAGRYFAAQGETVSKFTKL
jgi:hypothetical protein